ncbi:hypothetical protein PLESTB_000179800 [Pleodorina starrii]|uniref:N6-adenosine-methyltransferase MT-A70-like n=1 Tax=Pleodorina starrii TaxID=330485 RepID=A0A9W6BBG3_9CHLO|nr:hypothetical protein PLESTM_000516900 [Pleodorina starrii]GLC49076.1 hypothetical protein PLESTB_000179800 [Pleodorina starrii]GLC66129.1 hypothetical protein PLESTF_000388000 [Pleodorina starrii]
METAAENAAANELTPEQRQEQERKEVRERIRVLREKLVYRCRDVGKWNFFTPASVDMPTEPALAEAEKTVFNIITGCLFDPTTLIPLDVQALHKKILSDPAGSHYEAALSTLGLSSPEPLVHKLASITFKFGPSDFSCIKIGQLAFADGVRMYITRVDRPALTRLTGIEDPERHKQQQQAQQAQQGQAGQAPPGPGQPGQPQPPPPGAAVGAMPGQLPPGPQMLPGPGGHMMGPVPLPGGGLGMGLLPDGGMGMPPVGPGMMAMSGGMLGPGGGPGAAGGAAAGGGMGGMMPGGMMGPGRQQGPGGMMGFPGGPGGMMGGGGGGPMGHHPVPPPMPPMMPPPDSVSVGQQQQQQQQPDAKRPRTEAAGKTGPGQGPGGGVLDLDDLLNKRSVKEKVKVEKGSELLDILSKLTARESARVEQFRTAGGSAIREHCQHLTKDECRRVNGAPVACHRLHFRRIVQAHTDVSLGNCSYLDTCRNMRTCKYVHYRPDPELDVPGMGAEIARLRASVPKYLQALKDPQWINCDVRSFDMTVLGKFGVIMADPPWEIHQDLPYGTMKDDEMLNLNIGCLQDNGVIFVWVTGRAMELARECMAKWGYKRVDELIWVKTNQLQRLIRTGRTGHWLNHSKEHCLVGIKGTPQLNRYVDCDVVVAEVRETSRKPDEMYSLLERLSPGTRKLEIFARKHNLFAGWVGLGNQLDTVNILEPDLRQRFKARYGFEPDSNVKCTVV